MAKPGTHDKANDELSSTVDRLLRKLPFADPHPGRASNNPAQQSGPSKRITGPIAGVARSALIAPPPTPQEQMGTWARVVLGGLVAAAMLQWPYAHDCGFRLGAYLLGVTISVVAGGWGAVMSWSRHMAVAHVASIGIVMWALGLGAAQVLPRTGYAKAEATWSCVDPAVSADRARAVTAGADRANPSGVGAADPATETHSASAADSAGGRGAVPPTTSEGRQPR